MSLLDDVSIVVTPNGYKAGTLFGVIPVPTEGAEEVTNGDFATDTGWTKGTGWTISGGAANASATTATLVHIGSLGTVANVRYLISMDVTVISGTVRVRNSSGWVETEISSSNTYNYYAILGSSSSLVIEGISSFTGSINSISVKEYTSADMDVTRATAATRVDEDGLVNYTEVIGAEEVTNGDFSNGLTDWTENGGSYATIVSGALNSNNSDAGNWYAENISQNVSFVNGTTYKLTFKAKNISGNLNLRITQGANAMASLDLTSTFVDYTYFYTANADNGSIRIFCNSAVGQFEIDNISVKEVTRDNVPRIDYTGGGCPHILAEPQRTNLVTYSEDFSDSSWFKANTTISSYSTTSPSGETNASTIVSTSGTSEQYIDVGSLSVTSGEDYTMSCFVKKKDYDFFLIRFTGAGGAFTAGDVFFNINNGTLGTVSSGFSGTITDFGNGWYKCSATTTAASTTGSGKVRLQLASSDNSYTIAGDGSSGTFVWGSQIEEGSYATSYIPTSGSTVTRNQDIFTRDGIGSLINSTEGVLFVEIAALADDLSARRISINDGSYNNIVEIGYTSATNEIKNRVKSGGGAQANMNYTATDILDDLKIALKWKVNDFAVWVNGVEVVTDTSGTAPIGLSKISFDRGDGTQNYFGKVKQLQVYDTALTDTQLAALTS